MKLIIDIGNSNIVIAIYRTDWDKIFRLETKDNQPQVYYERGLADILFEWGIKVSEIQSAIVSSVVPDMNEKINNAIKNVLNIDPVLINPEIIKSLPIHVTHINEIGSDLVANAFAAVNLYKKPTIVVDFGTALTFTVVHPSYGIQGVTIAPGIKTAISSLYTNTAQLPAVPLSRPDSAIGKDTSHAIQAGIIIGYEGLVDHLINRIKAELDEEYMVVGTGGLSESLSNITKSFDEVNKMLTLEGIRMISGYITG
jgi:type III pantothenate kinase